MNRRALTEAEKRHVHPWMQQGADAGKLWRLPHKPNSAILDMHFVSPPPREKRATEYMRDNPNRHLCSRCGEPVEVGPDTAACICTRCLNLLAELATRGYWDDDGTATGRLCTTCGGPRPNGKRKGMCEKCARTRKTELARERGRNSQNPDA